MTLQLNLLFCRARASEKNIGLWRGGQATKCDHLQLTYCSRSVMKAIEIAQGN